MIFSLTPTDVAAQAEEPTTLVIEGGTPIDGNGGAPVLDALIIIRGNRIEAVSRKGQARYPADAQGERGQIRSWLFRKSSSVLRALRAILLCTPTSRLHP